VNAATKTVPATPGCAVAAGPDYPPQARVQVERYWYHLELAREAASREKAARHAHTMSQAAAEVADALARYAQAAPGTHADPLAWTDVSRTLTGLAMALDGARAGTAGSVFDDAGAPDHAWEHLAQAATRAEFAAAWEPIGRYLRRRARPGSGQATGDEDESDDGKLTLRAFAVGQVVMAASAITGARW
jgi:hypothetical protein